MEQLDHLFRHESGRLVATLSRVFGVHNLALAEDAVQDAFCRAAEVWRYRGMPENPAAWLMTTARNRAMDMLRRERTARTAAPRVARDLDAAAGGAANSYIAGLFDANLVKDDLLRMMFTCCDPRLREEAQVAVVLHILCGFSVDEIAAAFLNTHSAVEKRVTRAKKVLAGSSRMFDLADADFAARLSAVQRALYLLFNEGYHGASPEAAVRTDICREAMRLAALLAAHPFAATPATYALCALMCLHAARVPGRLDAAGSLVPLIAQDRSRWDAELVADGLALLDRSATGSELTEYHVEAAIAAVHATAPTTEHTDWKAVVCLYDMLLELRPSPVVALNRAIAVGQLDGPERGLAEIHAITDGARLAAYPFYAAALGELELQTGRRDAAAQSFRKAITQARNIDERRFLEKRLQACEQDRGRDANEADTSTDARAPNTSPVRKAARGS